MAHQAKRASSSASFGLWLGLGAGQSIWLAHQACIISIIWARAGHATATRCASRASFSLGWPRSGPPGGHHQHHLALACLGARHQACILSIIRHATASRHAARASCWPGRPTRGASSASFGFFAENFCLRDEQATVTKRTPTTSFGPGWPGGAHHEHMWPQWPPGTHPQHHLTLAWLGAGHATATRRASWASCRLWLATMAHQARIISIIWLWLSRSRAHNGHQACIRSIIRPLACSEERIMQACIICIISEPGI